MDMGNKIPLFLRFDFVLLNQLVLLSGCIVSLFRIPSIPFYLPFQSTKMMGIISFSLFFYLFGKIISSLLNNRSCNYVERDFVELKFDISIFLFMLKSLFFVLLMVSVALFYFLFWAYLSNMDFTGMKLEIITKRTYGLSRIVYIILPYLGLLIWGFALQIKGKIKFNNIYILIPLLLLMLTLFKGTVLFFLLKVIGIYIKCEKKSQIPLLRILIIFMIFIFIVSGLFFFSEGKDIQSSDNSNSYMNSVIYFFDRLLLFSLEGLNGIISLDLPSDIFRQVMTFFGLDNYQQGLELTKILTGSESPSFSTVPTLYGVGWRNGGYFSLALLFILLGVITRSLLTAIYKTRSLINTVTFYSIYIVLIGEVQTGDILNHIRGPILSIFIIHLFIKLLFCLFTKTRVEMKNENPVS